MSSVEPVSEKTTATERNAALVEQARRAPGVAEAMRVFELASMRAPMVRPVQPVVRFSTGANS